MRLPQKTLNAVPKSMLENADKQIRVGIARTDIDAIWAELYEKGITKPSNEQIVELSGYNKEKVSVC